MVKTPDIEPVEAAPADRLRALLSRLYGRTEAERERWARLLHDDISQQVMALKFGLAALVQSGHPQAAELLAITGPLAESVRDLAAELRPGVPGSLGLPDAIRWQAARTRKALGIPVQCELSEVRTEINVATVAFRILQESLANVEKHARAAKVVIRLEAQPESFLLQVIDDGRGFRPNHVPAHCLGIVDMRERAGAAGGTLAIESRPGRGTRVTATLPLPGSGHGAKP